MEQIKMTEEELYKAVDALLEDLEPSDVEDTKVMKSDEEVEVEVEAKTETETEEVVEKAAKKKIKEDEEEEDENEEGEEKEQPEQFQKKKKSIKKSIEVDEDEYNELLAKAKKSDDDLQKTEEVVEEDTLQKAMDAISELKKSIDILKKTPMEKKSVDGLEVIQKGNADGEDEEKVAPKNLLKSLTRSKVANIMVEDLIKKGVEGVATQDVCEFEANGYISNTVALEKTLEAVNKRHIDGLL